MRLPPNPSKEDEIQWFYQFVDNLPSGCYLALMLKDTPRAVADNIRNDFAFDPLLDLWTRQREAGKELTAVEERVLALRKEVAELEARKERVADEIDRIRHRAYKAISDISG